MSKINQEKWLRIDLAAPEALADPLADFLMGLGADGVFQDLPVYMGEGTCAEGCPKMTAYLMADQDINLHLTRLRDYVEGLALLFPQERKIEFVCTREESPDWAEEWKKYFKPLRVGNNLVIKPSWETYPSQRDDLIIEIDPGMAFGTGQHPTTRMCLEALEGIMVTEGREGKWEILDVGSGTGILAIAAAKLGAKKAIGLDIDGKAVAMARENAHRNSVADKVEFLDIPITGIKSSVNLIVANLTLSVLIELKSHFISHLKDGGYLIVSGLLSKDKKDMDDAFLGWPWELLKSLTQEDWLCLIYRKGRAK